MLCLCKKDHIRTFLTLLETEHNTLSNRTGECDYKQEVCLDEYYITFRREEFKGNNNKCCRDDAFGEL